MRLKEIYEKYYQVVEFMIIYGVEPHSTDEWWLGESRMFRILHSKFKSRAAINIKQPDTMEERNSVAARAHEKLFDREMPLYVDKIDNKVSDLYTGRPTRIYLIGKDGKVVLNQGIGPYAFNPDGLAPAIEEYLKK